jgi:hypothetical protein
MNFPAALQIKQTAQTRTDTQFWDWFISNEKYFIEAIRKQKKIEKNFFRKLAARLHEWEYSFSFLAGMNDDHTAELIFTAEGDPALIPLVEDFVAAAPHVEGWKFIALKPRMDINNISIEIDGYKFNAETIGFYDDSDPAFPDEVVIAVVHNDLSEENAPVVMTGTCLFIENSLGELACRTQLDSMQIIRREDAKKELIPICKLESFLLWRHKEFIEQYELIMEVTENDEYKIIEAGTDDGQKLHAVVNNRLLSWDQKPSHPWILLVSIEYCDAHANGLPTKESYQLVNDIQQEFLNELKDEDGYLNIGMQSAEGSSEIFFAGKEFRKPARVAHKISRSYEGKQKISFIVYKDKYWKSFERFCGKDELHGRIL